MVNVLPEAPSFGTQFARSLGAGFSQEVAQSSEQIQKLAFQKAIQKRQSESFKKQTGIDISAFSPQGQEEFVKQFAKAQAKEQLIKSIVPDVSKNSSGISGQATGEKTDTGLDFADLSSQQRTKLGLIDPNLGRQAVEEEKLSFKKQVHQKADIDKSYDTHKDFIDSTTSSYKSFETEMKPRMLQMQKLNSEELIKPSSAAFLEKMGIPLGVLENPNNELYSKLSQDLLKGLPESYGNRILKVEVENFLKTIPTLTNSPEGRRMIASNFLKLGEMKEVYYKEMRRQQTELLDKNKKFPKDFEQRVFDNTLPRINKLNEQFVKLSEIKSIPKNTVPFFNPQGDISFVPADQEHLDWATKNGGERIW
jgi:hypothetical protein